MKIKLSDSHLAVDLSGNPAAKGLEMINVSFSITPKSLSFYSEEGKLAASFPWQKIKVVDEKSLFKIAEAKSKNTVLEVSGISSRLANFREQLSSHDAHNEDLKNALEAIKSNSSQSIWTFGRIHIFLLLWWTAFFSFEMYSYLSVNGIPYFFVC